MDSSSDGAAVPPGAAVQQYMCILVQEPVGTGMPGTR